MVFSLDVCIHLVVYIFTMPLKKKNKNDKEEDISINWYVSMSMFNLLDLLGHLKEPLVYGNVVLS